MQHNWIIIRTFASIYSAARALNLAWNTKSVCVFPVSICRHGVRPPGRCAPGVRPLLLILSHHPLLLFWDIQTHLSGWATLQHSTTHCLSFSAAHWNDLFIFFNVGLQYVQIVCFLQLCPWALTTLGGSRFWFSGPSSAIHYYTNLTKTRFIINKRALITSDTRGYMVQFNYTFIGVLIS